MPRERNQQGDLPRLFGVILPSLPSLLLRCGGSFLRFKRDVKKGAQVFERELVNQGVDREIAAGLTTVYVEGGELLKYLQLLR
jgi:hypothetical protein